MLTCVLLSEATDYPEARDEKMHLGGPLRYLWEKRGPYLRVPLCSLITAEGWQKGHTVRHTASANRQHQRDSLKPRTEPGYISMVEGRTPLIVPLITSSQNLSGGPCIEK